MSADAFLAAGPIWMEPVAGGADGHGLERSVRASAGFGPCRCGESLLIVDVGAGSVRCATAMSEGSDRLLLQTFTSVVDAGIVTAASRPLAAPAM